MDSKLIINSCKEENIIDLKIFLKEEWSENHILVTNNKVFDWYYKNENGSCNFIIAYQNDKIQGVLGFIPNSKFDQNLIKNDTFWLALWKVKVNQEKNLLGLKLLNFLESEYKFQTLAVNGINTSHPGMYRALGYKSDILNHYILVNENLKQTILINYNKIYDKRKYRNMDR